ncbi:hypothetical protein [Superficieibacter electus]|uniref:hypothetical protein n=1 Tax=Superficieibacter electus TaxID=2022662 RepID=UPI00159EE1D1|nr:hypothetical protein [Superficieibacter electus]
MHCPQCQSFFVPAPDILGIENLKKPKTSQKFGMWSGVRALIAVHNLSATLLAPPGVISKLPAAFPEKIKLVTLTTGQHMDYLFNTALQYPLIYIRDFGRKTYELVRSLRVSYSDNAVYACSDTLMTRMNEVTFRINLNQARMLYEQMRNTDPGKNNIFIRTTELLAAVRISPAKASDEFRKNNIVHLVHLLPAASLFNRMLARLP